MGGYVSLSPYFPELSVCFLKMTCEGEADEKPQQASGGSSRREFLKALPAMPQVVSVDHHLDRYVKASMLHHARVLLGSVSTYTQTHMHTCV